MMEAIILAGGLGTRLRSVVNNKPKALSTVAGKPFLSYVIDHLVTQKVDRFIFSLGYMSGQIIEFLETSYPQLAYSLSVESTPLGTGGAIKQALEYSTEENVIVVNADSFFNVDLQAMFDFHIISGADCTIALKKLFRFDRYGTVELDDDMRITAFKIKEYRDAGFIHGGYLLVKRNCFEGRIGDKIFSMENDFLENYVHKILINGFVSDGYFIDIGIPSHYDKAQQDFKNINDLLK